MKRSALIAMLVGMALVATLLAGNDLGRIGGTLLAAGWSILFVVAAHLPQTLLSALGWRALIAAPVPGRWTLYRLRWVRDSINSLLPVGQVGGDLIRVRLLARQGVPGGAAAASAVVDVLLEVAAQIAFTLGAATLLLAGPHVAAAVPLAIGVTVGCVVVVAVLAVAQRLGVLGAIERLVARGKGWAALDGLAGLHDGVVALFRQPRRFWSSVGIHLAAWAAGGVETWVALRVIGVDAGIREAVVIEALTHAVRAAGFMIPGAVGVQEGGYLLVCGLFGIAPQDALALSLIRRLRELILGVPGLILWHWLERAPKAAVAEPA